MQVLSPVFQHVPLRAKGYPALSFKPASGAKVVFHARWLHVKPNSHLEHRMASSTHLLAHSSVCANAAARSHSTFSLAEVLLNLIAPSASKRVTCGSWPGSSDVVTKRSTQCGTGHRTSYSFVDFKRGDDDMMASSYCSGQECQEVASKSSQNHPMSCTIARRHPSVAVRGNFPVIRCSFDSNESHVPDDTAPVSLCTRRRSLAQGGEHVQVTGTHWLHDWVLRLRCFSAPGSGTFLCTYWTNVSVHESPGNRYKIMDLHVVSFDSDL